MSINLIVADGYQEMLRANGLDSLEALFNVRNDGSLGKPGLPSWRERLHIPLREREQSHDFFLKRFTNPPLSARREVHRSRSGGKTVAGVEWAWLRRFAADGIPCPTPIALGEEVQRGRECRSALLMAGVPGRSLEAVSAADPNEALERVSTMLGPLASLIRRMHENEYVHRDLYLSHIFFDAGAAPEQALHLIDLQRVLHPSGGMSRWVEKDLAALNYSTPSTIVSTRNRVRWLARYLGTRKLGPSGRRLLYRVVGKTQQIASHDKRRNVRLQGETA